MLFPSVNKQKSWLFFILTILTSLSLYFHFSFQGTLDERGVWIDRSISQVLSPFQSIFRGATEWTSTSTSRISELWTAQEENLSLKARMTEQSLLLQKLGEIERENLRLKSLLKFKDERPIKMRAARVIARDVSLFFRTIDIDLNAADGVQRGMAVVSAEGAVGRILRTSSSGSTVLLVNDVNSRLDGVIQRSRSQVIVGGSVAGDLNLQLLPRRSDVQVGDVVVTAGTGGLFPQGFKIGTMTKVEENVHSVLEEASLEPAVQFGSLEEVFVVLNEP